MTIHTDPRLNERLPTRPANEHQESLEVAAALIVVGAVLLLGQLLSAGWLTLPALALIFYAGGLLKRSPGLIIPGGILGGISLGILVADPGAGTATEADGGRFLLAFALGWASITLLTALFTEETHWWALIPGIIVAIVGVAILIGGAALDLVAFAGTYWPILLIAGGLYLLYRTRDVRV